MPVAMDPRPEATTEEAEPVVPASFGTLMELVSAMPSVVRAIEQCRTLVEAQGFQREAAEQIATRFGDVLWAEIDRLCVDRRRLTQ